VHYLVGYAARGQGLYDDAIAAFQRALAIQPDGVDVIANLGYIAYERGNNTEAEALLRRAIALDEKHFPAHYDLGRLLVRLKQYDEALTVLRRGVTLGTDDPGIHYQLFIALSRLKRKDDAERELFLFKSLEEKRKQRKRGEDSTEGTATDEQLPPPDAGLAPSTGKPSPGPD